MKKQFNLAKSIFVSLWKYPNDIAPYIYRKTSLIVEVKINRLYYKYNEYSPYNNNKQLILKYHFRLVIKHSKRHLT